MYGGRCGQTPKVPPIFEYFRYFGHVKLEIRSVDDDKTIYAMSQQGTGESFGLARNYRNGTWTFDRYPGAATCEPGATGSKYSVDMAS
jgi:hypothetical protein